MSIRPLFPFALGPIGGAGDSALNGTPWNIANLEYTGKFATLGSESFNTRGIQWSPDGYTLYTQCYGGDYGINIYSASVPFDVSTITLLRSFSSGQLYDPAPGVDGTAPKTTASHGIFIAADGKNIIRMNRPYISWLRLDDYWDFDTSHWLYSVDVSAMGFTNPNKMHDLTLSLDGKHLYIDERAPWHLHHYTLDAPYDLSTIQYQETIATSYSGHSRGVIVAPDGRNIYMCHNSANNIVQFRLNTPFSLADTEIVATRKLTANADEPSGGALSLTISPDGYYAYAPNSQDVPSGDRDQYPPDKIFQYRLG